MRLPYYPTVSFELLIKILYNESGVKVNKKLLESKLLVESNGWFEESNISILKLTVFAEPALITFAIANPREGNSAF